MSKTESLYFRGSLEMREAAEKFGKTQSMTLSSALGALVERGLAAVANERSAKALESDWQRLSQEVAVLRERDQKWSAFFASLQGQLQALPVGRCPACHKEVTALDQMLRRRCPWNDCGRSLERVERGDDVSPALAGLVGAIGGLLVGLAATQGSRSTS